MAEISANDVWKVYGGRVKAVQSLNLDVRDGEFVSLVGPSGCGKSSTLRMIAGLEEITRGEMFIGGRMVNHLEPGERDVAMVFENYALLPHMTAFENIAFPLRIKNEGSTSVNKKVNEIAALLEMEGFLHEKAGSLGGGQKQRVGVARALIKKSSVLLMDEPISHLDADLRARTRGELARLQKVLGLTTVYVTHDQIEALAMADRIAVMNFGVLQQFGTPDQLYNHPENKFVADFIGEPPMNFLTCQLSRSSQGIQLRAADFCLMLNGSTAAKVSPDFAGGEVWIGVRPIDVQLRGPEAENVVRGAVINYSPGCERSLAEVQVGSETVLVQCSPDVTMREGDTVSMDVTSRRFQLFDCRTELNLVSQSESAKEGGVTPTP